jgi:hypothetical protein
MSATKAAADLRRQFQLPEEDVEFLDGLGLNWETICDGGVQWLVVHNYPLPVGFNVPQATLLIRIVPGYPAAALDMVYVHPPLNRTDNRGIRAVSGTSIAGLSCQQWSRHYNPAHPWRPNIDSVGSHLHAAEEWFRRALL